MIFFSAVTMLILRHIFSRLDTFQKKTIYLVQLALSHQYSAFVRAFMENTANSYFTSYFIIVNRHFPLTQNMVSYSMFQYVSPFTCWMASGTKAAPPVCLTMTHRPVIQTVNTNKRLLYITTPAMTLFEQQVIFNCNKFVEVFHLLA